MSYQKGFLLSLSQSQLFRGVQLDNQSTCPSPNLSVGSILIMWGRLWFLRGLQTAICNFVTTGSGKVWDRNAKSLLYKCWFTQNWKLFIYLHPHVVANLSDFLSSVEHKIKMFDEFLCVWSLFHTMYVQCLIKWALSTGERKSYTSLELNERMMKEYFF